MGATIYLSDEEYEALDMCVDQVSTSMEAASNEYFKNTEKPLNIAHGVLRKYRIAKNKKLKLKKQQLGASNDGK